MITGEKIEIENILELLIVINLLRSDINSENQNLNNNFVKLFNNFEYLFSSILLQIFENDKFIRRIKPQLLIPGLYLLSIRSFNIKIISVITIFRPNSNISILLYPAIRRDPITEKK